MTPQARTKSSHKKGPILLRGLAKTCHLGTLEPVFLILAQKSREFFARMAMSSNNYKFSNQYWIYNYFTYFCGVLLY